MENLGNTLKLYNNMVVSHPEQFGGMGTVWMEGGQNWITEEKEKEEEKNDLLTCGARRGWLRRR